MPATLPRTWSAWSLKRWWRGIVAPASPSLLRERAIRPRMIVARGPRTRGVMPATRLGRSGAALRRANQIANRHGAAVLVAHLPRVVGGTQTGGQFAHVLEGVAAQAGEEAVHPERE